MSESLTVFVPAYNEENNLEKAVEKYDDVVREIFDDYEFLVFNDGSTDKTSKVAMDLCLVNEHVKVFHNKKNRGLGYCYKKAVEKASKDFFVMLSGEGECLADSVKTILGKAGEVDIVIPYISNVWDRPLIRRIITSLYTSMINLFFGQKIKYYMGYCLHKTDNLRLVKMSTNSFGVNIEILVQLLRWGCSYVEVPYYTTKTKGTSAFRIKNLFGIGWTIIKLLVRK